jgi:hypothetical protein
LIFEKFRGLKRLHTPFENLYPTSIGKVLREIQSIPELNVIRKAPRYYPEFAVLASLPIVREFLTWNLAVLLGRKTPR